LLKNRRPFARKDRKGGLFRKQGARKSKDFATENDWTYKELRNCPGSAVGGRFLSEIEKGASHRDSSTPRKLKGAKKVSQDARPKLRIVDKGNQYTGRGDIDLAT